MSFPSLTFAGLLVLLGGASLISCSKSDPGVVEVANGSKSDDDGGASGDDEDDEDDECEPGEERCECRSNERCDEGLVCLSDLCVEVEGGEDDEDSDDDSDDEPAADDDVEPEPADDAEPEPADDDDLVIPVNPEPVPAGDDDVEPEPDTPVGEGGAGPEPEPVNAGGTGGVVPQGGTGGDAPVGVGGNAPVGGQPNTGGAGPVNPADNLISNGDFSAGGDEWKVDDSVAAVGYSTATGAMCVILDSSQVFVTIGWPLDGALAVTLDPASTYELSYDASASDPSYLQFDAKAGEAVDPYDPHFLDSVAISSSPARYTHQFQPSSSNPSGIVFLLAFYYSFYGYSTEVCIDNVVLRAL